MKHFSLSFPGTSKSGFTLTELTIVIGVVGIIIGAIWVAADSVNERNHIDQAVDEVHTISQNMLTFYTNRSLPAPCAGPYDITANAVSTGVVPTWAIIQGTPCTSAANPWSGAPGSLTISESPVPSQFRVTFTNVPTDACIALLLAETNCDPSQAGCPMDVVTPGGVVPANPGPPANWQNMTPGEAASLCH